MNRPGRFVGTIPATLRAAVPTENLSTVVTRNTPPACDHDFKPAVRLRCAATLSRHLSFSSDRSRPPATILETSDTPGRRVRKSAENARKRPSAYHDYTLLQQAETVKETAQIGSSQTKEASETMVRAASESADLIKNCYLIGLNDAHEYKC